MQNIDEQTAMQLRIYLLGRLHDFDQLAIMLSASR